jgi:hypothetical protein
MSGKQEKRKRKAAGIDLKERRHEEQAMRDQRRTMERELERAFADEDTKAD